MMNRRWKVGGLAAGLWMAAVHAAGVGAGAGAGAGGYDYYVSGDPHSPTPGRTAAALMLSGGGEWPHEAFRWFAEKSGHGHLVILRASLADSLQRELAQTQGGFASYETIVFHGREAASDPRVLAIIRHADGIYLGGGDQSRYVRFWKGTPVNAALDAHVKNGRPIGGTSAGLAILGGYAYGATDGGSLLSRDALQDPAGPHVTLVRDFLHLPFLHDVITDTHLGKRDRYGRLITFVARLAAEENNPRITGIGVDEDTILCVDRTGLGRVFTVSGGYAWLIRPLQLAQTLAPGKPLDMHAVPLVAAGPGSVIDLASFSVERPAFAFTVDINHGVLLGNDRTTAARADPVKHWSLGVHGGAGVIDRGDLTPAMERAYRDGLNAALAAGANALRAGGSSLNAVEAAVRVLEDDPLFNAGRGAVFDAEGRNELDAAIMDGRTRRAGAVAGVTRTKNPVSLARAVMEQSNQVMLAGDGADAFSKAKGLTQVEPGYFRTEQRWKQYLEWKAEQSTAAAPAPTAVPAAAPTTRAPYPPRDRTHMYGTVGAVALDQDGHLAAATSTGGLTGKRWGRIGDSPVIGAGTYAEDGVAAVSATGTGEFFIRTSAARQVRDRLQWQKVGIQDAADDTIEDIESLGGDGAILGMDGRGQVAFSMNSIGMYRGWVSSERAQHTAIYVDEVAAP